MKAPKVSVLCLAYNQIKFIRQALESVVSQKTDFDFEVIINDDASNDGTADVIREYQKKYPQIVKPYFQKENQYSKGVRGLTARFLLPRAAGEYIAMCEGDDYFTDTGKLQMQADFLDRNPGHSLCFHPVKVVYENNEAPDYIFPADRTPSRFTLKELVRANYIQTNSVMYRRAKYDGLPLDILPGDWFLHLYHAQHGRIGFLDRVMSVYRKHSGGIWWSTDANREGFFRKHGPMHLAMYLEVFKMYGHENEYREIIINNIVEMARCVLGVAQKDKWQETNEAARLIKHHLGGLGGLDKTNIFVDKNITSGGIEPVIAVSGDSFAVTKAAADTIRTLIGLIWDLRLECGAPRAVLAGERREIILEFDRELAEKKGADIEALGRAAALSAGGTILGIKSVSRAAEDVTIGFSGDFDETAVVEKMAGAAVLGGVFHAGDVLKTRNCTADVVSRSKFAPELPGNKAVILPFIIDRHLPWPVASAFSEKLKDLTLITCSYNTPVVVEAMLKSYAAHHGGGPHRLIIFENSTNDDTAGMLDSAGVPYIRNRGGTHPESLDEALKICATKYALVVDSDVVFNRPITALFDIFRRNDGIIMGEVCGDRGGFLLHERVHPWFMFVDVEKLNNARISFYDRDRITSSGSEGFYRHVPLQTNDGKSRYYDVGATFFEDIKRTGFRILNCKADPDFFTHYEGMSWKKISGIANLMKSESENMERYMLELERYGKIILNGKFSAGAEKRSMTGAPAADTAAGKSMSISAVVPVIEGGVIAGQCIESLVRDMGDRDEVVVVAADSRLARKISANYPEKPGLKFLAADEEKTIAAMYNKGITGSSGELVVLIREDMICSSGFFEGHRSGHIKYPEVEAAVLGSVEAAAENGAAYINQYLKGAGMEQTDLSALGAVESNAGPGFFNTSNVSIKREFFSRHGLFDMLFADTVMAAQELGRRFFGEGLKLVYMPLIKAVWKHPLKFSEYAEIKYFEGRYYYYYLDKMRFSGSSRGARPPAMEDQRSWQELISGISGTVEGLMEKGKTVETENYISTMFKAVFFRGAQDSAKENSDGESLFFEKGKWGVYTAGKKSGFISVSSEYNPAREAELIVSSIPADKCVLFIGAGMGFHIREYMKQHPFAEVKVFEPHEALFGLLRPGLDMKRIVRITSAKGLPGPESCFAVIPPALKSSKNIYSEIYKVFQTGPDPGEAAAVNAENTAQIL
jgi:glycosyltransferase involved in cell wall biosynthesis